MPGVECPRFVGDDGTTFSIPGTGEFTLGDYVFVDGAICIDCPSICQEGPAFETSRIAACNMIPPSSPLFSACGTLVQQAGGSVVCTVFQADADGTLFALDIIPPKFQVGDHVRVTSGAAIKCLTLCEGVTLCLNDNTMQLCGSPVDACGLVVDYSGGPIFNCTNFISDSGQTYFVENLGPFGAGHRARITGFVEECPGCKMVNGCVYANQVIGCYDITGDGSVNVGDLIAAILAWGPCTEACAADVDGNGAVDVDDLVLIILNWS